MSKKVVYAWDTSVLLAWLEEDSEAPLSDIENVVAEIDKGKVTLVVSVVVYTEVLKAKHTEDQVKQFEDFLLRSNILVADVDLRISQKAEGIRSSGESAGRKIKTPDAQHLATAIIYKVDVFHTLDEKLIKLSSDPLVDGLSITLPIPSGGQGSLDFGS